MADLLAAHFSGGSLVAAKLGGGERPVCGNPGTGALWRDLGFVAQRYVVKVLWYSKNNNFEFVFVFLFVFACFYSQLLLQQQHRERNLPQLFTEFSFQFKWMRYTFVVLNVGLQM